MKYKLLFFLFFFPLWIYAQDIDKSMYQEITLSDAYESSRSSLQTTNYYRSTVHFETIYVNNLMGHTNVIFYQDSEFMNLYFYGHYNFSQIQRFQIVNIYYRIQRVETARAGTGYRNILAEMEFISAPPYFIIGDRYRILDNLRLRSEARISGNNILMTIQRDEWVIVLEEGNIDTIDGIKSAWVKVKLVGGNNAGKEGWCFGGYLGYYDR